MPSTKIPKYGITIPTVYDLDGTWGITCTGRELIALERISPVYAATCNLLWIKMYENFGDEIAARYTQLRDTLYTEENIMSEFDAFFNDIPELLRTAEKKKWPNVPNNNLDYHTQINEYVTNRLAFLDMVF